MRQIQIPARFNGPPNSGNGGYSCGVLAAFIDGPSRVRLHVPLPLDRELRVVEAQDGRVEMYDGDTLVIDDFGAIDLTEYLAAVTENQANIDVALDKNIALDD